MFQSDRSYPTIHTVDGRLSHECQPTGVEYLNHDETGSGLGSLPVRATRHRRPGSGLLRSDGCSDRPGGRVGALATAAASARDDAASSRTTSTVVIALVTVVGALALAGFALLIVRSITRPLDELRLRLHEIAASAMTASSFVGEGDSDSDSDSDSDRDAIGRLDISSEQAVVADEVRNLASDTSTATEAIGQLVHAIRSDTSASVDAIASFASVIDQADEASAIIADAVDEQSCTTAESSAILGETAGRSEAIIASMQVVFDASMQTTAGSTRLATCWKY